MLQTFRDNLRGTVAIILVGLICIPFALFGIDSLFNTQVTAQPVAEVNGEEISENDFNRALQMRRSQLAQQLGDNIPPQFLSDERLRGPVLESLVQRQVLLQVAAKEGMTVGASSIDQIILDSPDFQVDGKFDANRYQALIRSVGYTSQSYKDVIKNEIVLNQFAFGLTLSGFALKSEVEGLNKLNLQTRDFDYLTVQQESLLEQVEVNEEEINTYYQENQNQYLTPETVIIEALELSAQDLASDIQVDDALITEEYEQQKSGFMPSTQRRAAHILLDPEADGYQATLDGIYQRLEQGEKFSDLAKEFSQDFGSKDSGGDVGVSTGDSFVPEFEQALAALSVGEVSQPTATDFGVHIIKLLDVSESAMPTLDEMRMELAQRIRQAQAEELFIEKLNDFKDFTYNVDDLSYAAEQLGLAVWESESFSRFNGVGVAANPAVSEAAFSAELIESGFTSDPIELDDESVVVIRVKQHSPEATKSLAEVTAEVEQSLRAEKATELAQAKAEEIIAAAKIGQSLQELAEANGLELNSVSEAKRRQSDVDQRIISQAFSLAVPEADGANYSSVSLAGQGVAVIKLTQVQAGDVSEISVAEQAAAAAQIGGLMGQVDFLNVAEHLVSQATVDY